MLMRLFPRRKTTPALQTAVDGSFDKEQVVTKRGGLLSRLRPKKRKNVETWDRDEEVVEYQNIKQREGDREPAPPQHNEWAPLGYDRTVKICMSDPPMMKETLDRDDSMLSSVHQCSIEEDASSLHTDVVVGLDRVSRHIYDEIRPSRTQSSLTLLPQPHLTSIHRHRTRPNQLFVEVMLDDIYERHDLRSRSECDDMPTHPVVPLRMDLVPSDPPEESDFEDDDEDDDDYDDESSLRHEAINKAGRSEISRYYRDNSLAETAPSVASFVPYESEEVIENLTEVETMSGESFTSVDTFDREHEDMDIMPRFLLCACL